MSRKSPRRLQPRWQDRRREQSRTGAPAAQRRLPPPARVTLGVIALALLLTIDDRYPGAIADGRQTSWTAVALAETGEIGQARGRDFTWRRPEGDAVSRYGMAMSLAQVPAAGPRPRSNAATRCWLLAAAVPARPNPVRVPRGVGGGVGDGAARSRAPTAPWLPSCWPRLPRRSPRMRRSTCRNRCRRRPSRSRLRLPSAQSAPPLRDGKPPSAQASRGSRRGSPSSRSRASWWSSRSLSSP